MRIMVNMFLKLLGYRELWPKTLEMVPVRIFLELAVQ